MPISRSFYFIRHGQTDWNAERRIQGQMDIPLNEAGREQARSAIPYFKDLGIDLIVSSPLSRAYETGEIIANDLAAPINKHDGLKERAFNSHEGDCLYDIRKKNDELSEAGFDDIGFFKLPAMEKIDLFKERVTNGVKNIIDENHDKKILIVGHGGIYRVLYKALKGDIKDYSHNAVPYYFEKRADNTWNIQKVSL